MLNRVSRDRWSTAIGDAHSPERRELNRSIWCAIQRWRRLPRFGGLVPGDVPEKPAGSNGSDGPTLDDVREAVADGRLGLSPRQQKIVASWLDGYSIAEIAAELELPPTRVSDEKYRALQKIRHQFDDAGDG
jgi:DNA-directed RNA polymerase specialized sigma24 family protein